MFGKLLKNDLKAQFHSVNVFFFVVAVLSVTFTLISVISDEPVKKVLSALACFVGTLFAFVFLIFAVAGLYSKTMFGRAGYLTLSLPVKTSKLVWSKTVSGLIWIELSFGIFLLSTVFLWKTLVDILGEDAANTADDLLVLFGAPSVKTIVLYLFYYILELAILSLALVQSIYFGITISHVSPFSRLGRFGSIIFIFVTLYLVSELSSKFGQIFPAGMCIATDEIVFTSDIYKTISSLKQNSAMVYLPVNFSAPALQLVLSLLLNIPTAYLVKNEVNVQ